MISGFYPRHEPFIDSRQSRARAAELSSSAPLHPPHAHNGVELVGTLGGKSLRNFLWAKHRAVSWLRQPVAGDRMGFATSVTDGGNDGMLGEQGRIPAGTESLEECIAALLVWHAGNVRWAEARGQRRSPTKKCYPLTERRETGYGDRGNAQFTGHSVNFNPNL